MEPAYLASSPLLGGSWVAMSGVISPQLIMGYNYRYPTYSK